MFYNIEYRSVIEVNTDPQRRCYNGCYAKSEVYKLPWQVIEYEVSADRVEQKLMHWRNLNEFAVKQRGACANSEYRKVNLGETLCIK